MIEREREVDREEGGPNRGEDRKIRRQEKLGRE